MMPAPGRWVGRRSMLGHYYEVFQFSMPRITQQWLDSIVYLYPTEDEARAGKKVGATGFLAVVSAEDEQLRGERVGHHYIVTNDHAVSGRESTAVRVNVKQGRFDVATVKKSEWESHPDGDDIAVAPLRHHNFPGHRYAAVNESMMLVDQWPFGPGDEVFFIGRYVDLEGKAQNVPVLRSGILSAYPDAPIPQPARGNFKQESILVEARSLSGFSGSPVFITPSPQIERSDDFGGAPVVREPEHRPCFLLGVDWGHSPWREKVRTKDGCPSQDGTYVEGNSGMMMVVPAAKLVTLLNTEVFRKMRQETEDLERKEAVKAPAVLDSTEKADEFDRFKNLTSDLLKVPKKELDEKRKEGE
jgi:hypothetical protein